MAEIQNLSKKNNFNNLIYYSKNENGSKDFISLKVH